MNDVLVRRLPGFDAAKPRPPHQLPYVDESAVARAAKDRPQPNFVFHHGNDRYAEGGQTKNGWSQVERTAAADRGAATAGNPRGPARQAWLRPARRGSSSRRAPSPPTNGAGPSAHPFSRTVTAATARCGRRTAASPRCGLRHRPVPSAGGPRRVRVASRLGGVVFDRPLRLVAAGARANTHHRPRAPRYRAHLGDRRPGHERRTDGFVLCAGRVLAFIALRYGFVTVFEGPGQQTGTDALASLLHNAATSCIPLTFIQEPSWPPIP
jgi:hypothetical protein